MCHSIHNGNRTECQSPIWSAIIRVINKIRQTWSRSLISQSQVWLQTELDDTKSCYQLIITITISENKTNSFRTDIQTSPLETVSKVKISPFWKFPFFFFLFQGSGCDLVIVANSVIGRFSWVDLVWLAASTVQLQPIVWLQPYRMVSEK